MTRLIDTAIEIAERAKQQQVQRLGVSLIDALPRDAVVVREDSVTVDGAGIMRRWQLDPRLRAIIGAGE